ncbi:deoxynucleoside kinase [Lewinella sp. IMCC34191]|uniref:deoxynucleoside kinase n=1 Tax=Lewinella sp. IMCC34191 TaxID=2259172 RepID=UPI000E2869CC|nr:deoxynucleoside kinase [Lewinella sp. IMCC34191]
MTLPSYVVIEGNIGAGKTTLARMLAERFNHRLVLEEFSDNPFLPLFYREPERYAFPVELFFMAERHKQLQAELSNPELFSQGTVADYLFIKTMLFARNSLNEQEFRLFTRLFRALDVAFPKPDLIVYLHRPVEALQANIRRRGREYEQDIGDAYLKSVQQVYLDYLRTVKETPVLLFELGEENFAEDELLFERIIAAMTGTVKRGLQTLELHSLRSSPMRF